MKIWNQAPLIRLILPFLAGILCAIQLPAFNLYVSSVVCFLFLFIASLIFVPGLKLSYKRSWLYGFSSIFLLFQLGYHLTHLKTERYTFGHFSLLGTQQFVRVRLAMDPVEKERSFKVAVEVLSSMKANHQKQCSGHALMYFQPSAAVRSLRYGDELLLHVNFEEISPPKNPGEFDYRQFMAYRNINYQAYVKTADWKTAGVNSGNTFLKYSHVLRDQLLEVLSRNNVSGEEYAVGAALLLGYSDKLQPDLISAYSATGVLHVLSVSGLHVAIVYVVLNWLLSFLDRFRQGKLIKAVVLLVSLWFYSMLTGLSPSVLRASTMFSFIVLAKTLDRHTNIYNTLAASAFVLLLFDPYLIMDTGFQLSYIAVIGIVYIQPMVYRWFDFDNRWLDQIWQVTAVSIAAQLATFPLGLYYFHQFPNYFLLSNLIVIPLSSFIIYVGIAVFFCAKIPFVAHYLSLLFSKCLGFLNYSVRTIEQWPNAVADGISLSLSEMLMIYAIIVLFFVFVAQKRAKALFFFLTALVLFLNIRIVVEKKLLAQKKLLVYCVPKTSVVEIIQGHSSILINDGSLHQNAKKVFRYLKGSWIVSGINDIALLDKTCTHAIVLPGDKRMLILSSSTDLNLLFSLNMKPDFVIVSKNVELKVAEIKDVCRDTQLIFDSSNSVYRIKKWKRDCEVYGLKYYDVTESGAFVTDL